MSFGAYYVGVALSRAGAAAESPRVIEYLRVALGPFPAFLYKLLETGKVHSTSIELTNTKVYINCAH